MGGMVQEANILAVDDDPNVLDLLEQALGSAGYRVLSADSGWNAVQVYENCAEPIHLLLTDVIMPDLTGPVLAERLRSRQPDGNGMKFPGDASSTLMFCRSFAARTQLTNSEWCSPSSSTK